MNIQEAVQLLNAYETWQPAYGQSGGDKESQFDSQAVNTATRLVNDYAMKGGDVSGFPQAVQKYTTPEYANFIASRGSGQWSDVLPALAVAGGGLAGVLAGGATAAGGMATGTEASAAYGVGGEFAGAPGMSLAEQAAAIGTGSTAGTAVGTGVGTGTAATTAGTVGTTAASASALDRILSGNGTASDYAALIGTGFDIYGANKQADATKEIADRFFNMGAPYRDELSRISENPQAFYDSPTAQKATESVLRRLSATHGNVAGSPYAEALTIDALYDQYGRERDRLAGFGGLTQYNAAAPGAAGSAIGAEANLYNSIGGGIADIATPRNNRPITLQDILRGVQV